jgi:hypothetical protein
MEAAMAVVMKMNWPGVSLEQYEQVRREVNWEGDAPDGGKFHVAWFDNGLLNVIDLWESQEQFQQFASERLMPGVQKLGIEGEPNVEISEVHAVFAPNV